MTTTDNTTATNTLTDTTNQMIPPPPWWERGNFAEILTSTPSSFSDVTTTDIFIVIFGTFVLSMFIAFIYRYTFKGKKYRQNYVQSLVILAVIIALVMLLVGSNIARAFTMAWALSIIRFRNNIKDTRDIGFVFFALAIGMTMWTQFYMLGFIWTICISAIFVFMTKFDIFKSNLEEKKEIIEQTIKIEVKNVKSFNEIFAKLKNDYESSFTLKWVSEIEQHNSLLTYKIENSWDIDILEFIEDIKEIEEVKGVQLVG